MTATPYAFDPHQADVRSLVPADAIVTASVGEVSGSPPVRFFAEGCAPADHVQIALSDGLLEVGMTTEMQAIPKDRSGRTLSAIGCAIAWSSTPGMLLAVDPGNAALATGTAQAPGTTVTATVGSASGSVTITVIPAGG